MILLGTQPLTHNPLIGFTESDKKSIILVHTKIVVDSLLGQPKVNKINYHYLAQKAIKLLLSMF